MRVRVRVVGKGVVGDPFRVELPTYDLIEIDYERRVAVVDIPDTDLPDDAAVRGHLARTQKLSDPDAPTMPSAYKHRWHEHLDDRYREHRGRFRPPLA
jgi:hypothetical protein